MVGEIQEISLNFCKNRTFIRFSIRSDISFDTIFLVLNDLVLYLHPSHITGSLAFAEKAATRNTITVSTVSEFATFFGQ